MDELLQKYFRDELSPTERLAFIREVEADPQLQKEFIDFQNLQALLALETRADDEETGRKDLHCFHTKTRKHIVTNLFLKVISYAAVVALLVTGTWFAALSYQPSDATTATHTLRVPAGQRACLTLEDGTEVWLNAKSTLTYPARFSSEDRRVALTGEAFFSVEKDSERPFIVSAKEVNIEVLGTRFNVNSYPEANGVRTSLLEGSVRMYAQSDASKNIILRPNQQALYRNGTLTVHELKSTATFLWKEGLYSFDNEPFVNILKQLEMYYDVRFVVKDPAILDFEYSGKFRQSDGVYEILRLMQKIKTFTIEIDKENNIITLKK